MALIPPFYLDTVVAIGLPGEGDGPKWVASGFLFGKPRQGKKGAYQVFLVTNKHVLRDKEKILIRVNPQATDKKAKGYDADLFADGKQLWAGHPKDDVDVAVLPINGKLLQDDNMQIGIFADGQHTLDVNAMKERGLSEGDYVYTLGFPMGLVGERRSSVIVKAGVIARLRETLEDPNHDLLADVTVFPGNSGGPVVTKPEMSAINGTRAVDEALLIGVVAAYVPYADVAISQQTGRPRIVFEENSGLTQIFSVDCIRETIAQIPVVDNEPPKVASPMPSEEAKEDNTPTGVA